MTDATFRISLDGEIPLEVFTASLNAWQESLKAAATVAGAPTSSTTWTVTELSHGTTNVGVTMHTATETYRREIEGNVMAMGIALKQGRTRDLSPAMEAYARQLATALTVGDGYSVTLSTSDSDVLITPESLRSLTSSSMDMLEYATIARSPSMTSIGRVEGKIQTLSSRDSLRFTLYDVVWDRAVACYIRQDQHGLLEDKWDKFAFVEGKITRDRESGRPLGIREITDVQVIPQRRTAEGPLPGRGALLGVLDPNTLPEEYVRRLRDD